MSLHWLPRDARLGELVTSFYFGNLWQPTSYHMSALVQNGRSIGCAIHLQVISAAAYMLVTPHSLPGQHVITRHF